MSLHHITYMGMQELREHLLSHQEEPVVFCNSIKDWPASKWKPKDLREVFGGQNLKFRIGEKNYKGVQWETVCQYAEATVDQFIEWTEGSATSSNPLSRYNPCTFWCYADYKYMAKLFKDQPEILQSVDWSAFGFAGRDGTDSTFWLGSLGAHTQCHYDTYGANLVAQIYGRKRWILFPPDQSEFLYPTRIPYEESSVFSKVKVTQPDLQHHPKFKNVAPWVVTLEPGQVMFVPHHWWHDVSSLSTSISINSWIELPCDDEERVKEAVTRAVVMAMMTGNDNKSDWLNPTEEKTGHIVNMTYLQSALSANITASEGSSPQRTQDTQHMSSDSGVVATSAPETKKPRISPRHLERAEDDTRCKHVQCAAVQPRQITFNEYRRICHVNDSSSVKTSEQGLETSDLVDCILQPRVIEQIADLLKDRINIS